MNMLSPRTFSQDHDFLNIMTVAKQGVVAVVSDDQATIESLAPVCEFLELKMEVVAAGMDLPQTLRDLRPMAVISAVDGTDQDGFHTMKVISRYDRDLPIMLLTEGDAVLMGAADAVQDLWGLTSVTRTSGFPVAGQLVACLFSAGRRSGCLRLVPV
jgi:FixJ family two-component response regulator